MNTSEVAFLLFIIMILLVGGMFIFIWVDDSKICENNGGDWNWNGGCFKKVDGSYVSGYFVELNEKWVFIEDK